MELIGEVFEESSNSLHLNHQILRYVWRPLSFMRGRKNELAALAAFILTVDRIQGWNKP
jgi:hypothetical protein